MNEVNNNGNIKERGGISVETQHIFPIIKKWLYSEKEIFLREIVSNASDAVTKMRRLISLGQIDDIIDDYKITVKLDKDARTITVSDNGVGMTADEVRSYICQIALSGALDFIEKYEGENEKSAPGIIGHFGLGFYSSFMVSDTVELVTRSYTDSPAVRWVCTAEGDYEITDAVRDERGTDVIMHITEDEDEFLSDAKLLEVLKKYCAFMPVEIYYEGEDKPSAEVTEKCECTDDEKEDGKCDCEQGEEKKPQPINDINPLWLKQPSECTDEEYKQFYDKLFSDYREPLFHIHINADYPLNFKGILYFPRLNHEYESLEGQVKLYYNQVFVADNIKEVIPEYLLMLKGVLDCPELPLNVSRSYLQNSSYVSKISAHIVKKVADKLNGMMNTDRERYEKLWDDLKLFVEYGCMRDRKFYDRVKGSVLMPQTDGKYVTIDEYLENAKDTHDKVIYYASDLVAQAQYISMYTAQDISVTLFDKPYDSQFMSVVENDKSVKFMRVDADVAGALKTDGEKYENEKLSELFKKISESEKLTVKYEPLKDEAVPAVLNISEQSRRMEEMMRMYRASGNEDEFKMPLDATLVLNSRSALVKKLGETLDEDAARRLWSLALLSQRPLTADELRTFLADSYAMLENSL